MSLFVPALLGVLAALGVILMLRRDARPGPQQWRCTACGHVGASPFDRCYRKHRFLNERGEVVVVACPLEPV